MGSGEAPASVDVLLAAGRPRWFADAACKEHPERTWHPELGESTAAAKEVCGRCLVQDECLQYALDDARLQGLWGGTSARERGRLRRPEVFALFIETMNDLEGAELVSDRRPGG